uniref:Uncharacterized protein n=1 Tax=Steinernema glaseri TaxID=37863 RepID=A0A1I7XW97_9BILA
MAGMSLLKNNKQIHKGARRCHVNTTGRDSPSCAAVYGSETVLGTEPSLSKCLLLGKAADFTRGNVHERMSHVRQSSRSSSALSQNKVGRSGKRGAKSEERGAKSEEERRKEGDLNERRA